MSKNKTKLIKVTEETYDLIIDIMYEERLSDRGDTVEFIAKQYKKLSTEHLFKQKNGTPSPNPSPTSSIPNTPPLEPIVADRIDAQNDLKKSENLMMWDLEQEA